MNQDKDINKMNQLNKNKAKYIALSERNYLKLRNHGEFGDSFDNVLTRILEKFEKLQQASGIERP